MMCMILATARSAAIKQEAKCSIVIQSQLCLLIGGWVGQFNIRQLVSHIESRHRLLLMTSGPPIPHHGDHCVI